MKILRYAYIVPVLLAALLFGGHEVFAASTTEVTASSTTADNDTITVRAYTFNDWPFTTDEQTDLGYIQTWDISQNYRIMGLSSGYYYSGLFTFKVTTTVTPNIGVGRTPPVVVGNDSQNIRVYIAGVQSNAYTVTVVFDNYYSRTVNLALQSITQTFTITNVDPVSFPTTETFTASLSNLTGSSLRKSSEPFSNGLAGVIASAIDDSTALAVIAGWLYDIKDQDYLYYNSLINSINGVITAQGLTNSRLASILSEIDLDFAQVQVILDLFPSYRTQVLQYWQQLLEMNAVQSSEASELESQYQDKEQQSATLAAGLGELVLPSVNANDFNILGNVDSTQKANFFGMLSIITNNSYITSILLIIVTGAIVGYILYGKKG